MNILVTGGAGFMGSNFIRHILQKYPQYKIVNLDKLTYAGNIQNLKDISHNENYTFVQGDIADEKIINEILPTIDVIVNYAAETHVDRSIDDPGSFLQTDVIGTYQLLEGVRHHNVSKMVQISTDEVFGSILEGEFHEKSPFEPNSPYSASKAGGDLLCRAYFKTYETPVVVTHSCNFYGPYQYPEKLIPLFITNLLEGKKVPVYGEGKNVREWIFTADHCKAIDRILHDGKPGEVYNIGSGYRLSNLDITKKLLNLTGNDESLIKYVSDRAGHDYRYAVNTNKLKQELNWEATISFDEALEETVDWYKNNVNWWKPIKESGDKFVDK